MSGVAVQQRRLTRQAARVFRHVTKAQHAEDLRASAASLLEFADNPHARASALRALDRADELERAARHGWYPWRPDRWRP